MRPDPASPFFDPGETTPESTLVEMRWEAIREMVAFARERLPFYRDHWEEAGHVPSPGSYPEGFEQVPLVTKADLVAAHRRRRSLQAGIEDPSSRITNVVLTTGTSGFNTFASLTSAELDGAGALAQARELWTMGVREGMRVLSVSPAWHALGLYESRALSLVGAVPVLPWGSLTPRFVPSLFDAIRALRPEHLLLTARAVRMLLEECERRGLGCAEAFGSVRYLGCAGEPLSPPFREHVIDRMGLEDLFERGGSGDGMFGGAECDAHRGHHIPADVHYVEVLSPTTGRPVPAGERGVAVVTNLTAGRSVYVRFDTEDVAAVIPGPCPCGRTHPVVEFYGRLADSVRLGDRLVTPADVRFAVDEVPSIRFRPFSMAAEGGRLVIGLGGAEPDRPEMDGAATMVSDLLEVPVTFRPGEVTRSGWKEERLEVRQR